MSIESAISLERIPLSAQAQPHESAITRTSIDRPRPRATKTQSAPVRSSPAQISQGTGPAIETSRGGECSATRATPPASRAMPMSAGTRGFSFSTIAEKMTSTKSPSDMAGATMVRGATSRAAVFRAHPLRSRAAASRHSGRLTRLTSSPMRRDWSAGCFRASRAVSTTPRFAVSAADVIRTKASTAPRGRDWDA